jgi:hypothetical protein
VSAEHAPLAGDWVLGRDFAVRSAGFAADGIDLFGSGDELRLVAVERSRAERD